ncbi:MAG TPA: nitrilase-related carbon-nitrogen hydrolase [bacterium]|nr:nitrilase-related carbon-nitrogen hydrolase [bacterium]
MARYLKVAAAQLGPNNEGTPVDTIVARMRRLMDEAAAEGAAVVAYPEMALSPYFPKRIREDADQFFSREVPPAALAPVIDAARRAAVVWHVGFCERDGDRRFNTAVLIDETGRVCGRYRKTHLPGTNGADAHQPGRVYEPYYFDSGDTGFRVFETRRARIGVAICQDRRYSETYRCLGLGGAEVMLIGYNTPAAPRALALNQLVMRAGAYENHMFVVGAAKAGVEDGLELIGGSCIISPLGAVLAQAATTGDELVTTKIDLDQIRGARDRWNFFGRRHPEHYGAITAPVADAWRDERLAKPLRR